MSCFKKKKGLNQTAPVGIEEGQEFEPVMRVTGLQYNTFVVQDDNTTLLIDPWLTGHLTLGDELMPCFFQGTKTQKMGMSIEDVKPDKVDAIILTQCF